MKTYYFYKRIFDISFALIFLIIFSPLILMVSIIIKVTSKGPIFYMHPRVGENNKEFQCIKFRTMYFESDKILKILLRNNDRLKTEFDQTFKLKKDPRITLFGKFLRKTSLDELPQFINVLKGEMSIVGPRPIVEKEKINYGKQIDLLLSVKPGISGLWQVKGRSKLTYKERKKLDIYYVKNHNLKLDLYIFFKTVFVMILPINRGAF